MIHPFRTDKAKLEEYLLELYKKGYTMKQAYKSVCQVINDAETMEDEQSKSQDDEEVAIPSKRKKSSLSEESSSSSKENETTSAMARLLSYFERKYSIEEERASVDSSTRSSLNDAQKSDSTKAFSSDESETSDGSNNEENLKQIYCPSDDLTKDDPISMIEVDKCFKKEADKEFKLIDKERLEDIVKLLRLRRISTACCKAAESLELPIKSIKWLTGIEKFIEIEITDLQNSTIKINYSKEESTEEEEIVKYIQTDSGYFMKTEEFKVAAACDLLYLLSTKNVKLETLNFDIEPCDKEHAGSFPEHDTLKIVLSLWYLHLMDNASINTKKFEFTISRKCGSEERLMNLLYKFLSNFAFGYLETIKLRVWESFEMISSLNCDQKLDKPFKLEENGWSQCDLTVYQQWLQAVELDIQDDLFQKDWEKFWHFKTIRLMSLGVDDVVKLVETYNQHTPHIGSIITVQTAHPLDLKAIRTKLSETSEKFKKRDAVKKKNFILVMPHSHLQDAKSLGICGKYEFLKRNSYIKAHVNLFEMLKSTRSTYDTPKATRRHESTKKCTSNDSDRSNIDVSLIYEESNGGYLDREMADAFEVFHKAEYLKNQSDRNLKSADLETIVENADIYKIWHLRYSSQKFCNIIKQKPAPINAMVVTRGHDRIKTEMHVDPKSMKQMEYWRCDREQSLVWRGYHAQFDKKKFQQRAAFEIFSCVEKTDLTHFAFKTEKTHPWKKSASPFFKFFKILCRWLKSSLITVTSFSMELSWFRDNDVVNFDQVSMILSRINPEFLKKIKFRKYRDGYVEDATLKMLGWEYIYNYPQWKNAVELDIDDEKIRMKMKDYIHFCKIRIPLKSKDIRSFCEELAKNQPTKQQTKFMVSRDFDFEDAKEILKKNKFNLLPNGKYVIKLKTQLYISLFPNESMIIYYNENAPARMDGNF
ncbi:Protein CBG21606 [Caenorhabditis briggsae]|uniref:Protein CBG21606 n=1 Tax=Caenorhabditis briggsae TaxID=6238 RepID=A8Y070_CAEBR|nr:Protein CBG21606 [Caenorhabditis briggsae]CAP38360.2 Protein CBG21606 [Caenorhabditis briggsae]